MHKNGNIITLSAPNPFSTTYILSKIIFKRDVVIVIRMLVCIISYIRIQDTAF